MSPRLGLSPRLRNNCIGFLSQVEGQANRVPLLALGFERDRDEGVVGEPQGIDVEAEALRLARGLHLRQLQRAPAAVEDHREAQAEGERRELGIVGEGRAHLGELAALREHEVGEVALPWREKPGMSALARMYAECLW